MGERNVMVRVKKLGKLKRTLEIEVPADIVAAAHEEVYTEVAKTATLAGFRPGKVPMDVIKLRYADAVKEEVLKRLIPAHFAKAVKESDLKTLGLPEVHDVKMDETKALSFSATFEIRPDVRLRSYKGITLVRKKQDVKDSDVEHALEHLRQRNAEYEAVSGRAVQAGDIAICDIESIIDEKELKKQEKVWINVDEKATLPEIVKALVGARPNEEKIVELMLPADYTDASAKGGPASGGGKSAKFTITIFEIKEKRLPQLNDEFAKSAGNYTTLSELKEKIKGEFKARREIQSKLDLESQILDKLLKTMELELPEGLIEAQRKKLYDEYVSNLKRMGHKEEDIKKNEKELQEKAKLEAQRSLKIYFILEEIAQREAIKVQPNELEPEIKRMAQQSGQSVEDVKKYLEEKELLDNLLLETREKKTLEFLLSNAKIEEEK